MNICKIHKIKMKEVGFERGYRIYSCEKCKEKNGKKK
jgi:hypothetical protein